MAISISDMLKRMHAGEVFSLVAVTYNKRKKEGGDLFEVDEAMLVQPPDKEEIEHEVGRSLTAEETKAIDNEVSKKKRPNHSANFTRNIVVLQEGEPTSMIRKIHPLLVIEFNGQETYP